MFKAKNNPEVSIIIPTYNRAHMIGRAIRSVLKQTYQDLEIIIVDDGSNDNTEEVVKKINNEKIEYVRHQKNRGRSAARNTGIKMAKGKYTSFLDDDDEWLPKKIEKQINKFQKLPDEVGVVYSGFCYISEDSGDIVFRVIPALRGKVCLYILKGALLIGLTAVIRKDCFYKVGLFDEKLPSLEDWDLWIRFSRYYEFDFVPDILAKYYMHGKQLSANLNGQIQGREKLIKKHRDSLSEYPSILSRHLSYLGQLYCLNKNRRKGQKYFWKAIKSNPFQIKNYINLFLSIFTPVVHKKMIRKRRLTIGNITFY